MSDPSVRPDAAPRTGGVPSSAPLAILAFGLATLGAVVAGVMLTGAANATALSDPGPAVRWGQPVVRAVHEVAFALTAGAAFVGGFLVPEHRHSQRRRTLARMAAASGLVWCLAGVLGQVLWFADVSGNGVGAPGFWDQLWTFTWELDLLRSLIISALMGGLAAAVAWWWPTRNGLAWAAVVALAALYPLALTGHAGGTVGHNVAVDAQLFHVLGLALWCGGLAAVLTLGRSLGAATATTVRRYSSVALVAYTALAISGVMAAWVRLGSWDGVATSYGTLVILKVVLLVILGAMGAGQRSRIVSRLESDPQAPGMFARLATSELVLMGAAVGLGVALSRSEPPVPQIPAGDEDPVLALTGYTMPAAPSAESWVTAWRIEPLLAAIAIAAVTLYLVGVLRLRRRGDAWPMLRTVAWVVGWALFFYATNGYPAVYGSIMFSTHMIMHMALMMVVPIFLVPGAPISLALRALPKRKDKTLGLRETLLAITHSRWVGFWSNPVVAAANFFISLVVFYWTDLFRLALVTHTGHLAMTIHFTLTGYLFVWVLIGIDPGPRKWSAPLRLMILIATLAAHAFFGVAMMSGSDKLGGGVFDTFALPWVSSTLADQQLAGGIAWGIGEVPTMILAILVCVDWARRDAAETRRSDRKADRDNDADLAAYNARLARLAGRDETNHPGRGKD